MGISGTFFVLKKHNFVKKKQKNKKNNIYIVDINDFIVPKKIIL
jgi:hypothetical protein